MKTQNADTTALFEAVADEFTEALRNGSNPSIDQFADQYPQVADRIRQLFPMLAMMERQQHSGAALPQFSDALPLKQPERLGDFLIEREIGRGGMGVVYQAVQESLGRRVALKLLAQNLLDQRSAERFEQEARVVANLHHTNIVPVYGIGQHEGYAYFVMQYIEGQSLDRVLVELQKLRSMNENGSSSSDLSTSAQSLVAAADMQPLLQSDRDTGTLRRDDTDPDAAIRSGSGSGWNPAGSHYWINVARVGRQIASALSYAHGQKILHRDIKPSNMILDEAGSVWVTDFGLARSFESDRLTRTGEVVGTLRYMPPEQMAGQSDVRSDVYGLGLTLYEMLTLRPANDESDHRRLIAQVTEGSPTSPRRLDPRIPRDLETIVLKCIDREPEKRYASAEEVHEDLTRFISGEPIQARRISLAERTHKWAKRRPAVAGLTLLAVLLASLGIAGITWKWREADRNYREAKKQNEAREVYFAKSLSAVDQMLKRVGGESLANVPFIGPVRTELLNDALAFYNDLLQDSNDDPSLQVEFGRIHRHIADIHLVQGNIEAASEALSKAIERFEWAMQQDPAGPNVIDWAEARAAQAMQNYRIGQSAEAEVQLKDVIAELQLHEFDRDGTAAEQFSHLRWLQVQADAYAQLGTVQQKTRSNRDAESSFEKALQYFDELPPNLPDLATHKMHASTLEAMARILEHTNRLPRSDELREKAVLILKAAIEKDPFSPDLRNRLAGMQQTVGQQLLNRGEIDAARGYITEAISTRRELVRDFNFPMFRDDLANGLSSYCGILQTVGNFQAAMDSGQESVQLCRSLVRDFPNTVDYQHSLARNCHLVATIATRMAGQENLDLSNEYHQEAYELLTELVLAEPNDQTMLYELGMVARNWAGNLSQVPDADPARIVRLLREAINLFQRLVESDPRNTAFIYQLAFCRTNLGKALASDSPDESAAEFAAACQTFNQLIELQPGDPRPRLQLTRGYGELSALQFQLGRLQECVESLRLGNANMEAMAVDFPDNANVLMFLSISRNQLGHMLKAIGETEDAEALFLKGQQERRAFLDKHPESVSGQRNLASSHTNLAWHLSYWRDEDQRDLVAALEHCKQATLLDSEAHPHWTGLAHVLLRQGDYEEAIAALDSCQNLEPVEEMAQSALRAMALWHLDQPEAARQAVSHAHEIRDSEAYLLEIPTQMRRPELSQLVDEALALTQE